MPDAYALHLASGSTTLCRCFRLERADGQVFGFTDHDRPVVLSGLTYEADAALDASAAAASLGLAPDELDATGALSASAITEDDIAAGLYDGAELLVFSVNWADPSVFRLLGRYSIGQIERGPLAFRAEIRSLAAALDRKEGRIHGTLCDVARLGDSRCQLALATWTATATVVSSSGAEIEVATPSALDPSQMSRGVATWTSGTNAGREVDIRAAASSAAGWTVSLWTAPPDAPQAGDTLSLVVGCDRAYATCRDQFGNADNFRGFPFLPGPDIAGEYAVPGDPGLDGGSRFI